MDQTIIVRMEGDDVVVRFSRHDYPAEVTAFDRAFDLVEAAEASGDAARIDGARRELNIRTVALLEAPLRASKRAYGLD